MTELEFYAEFFCDKPDQEPMFPEMVGSCTSWEDARQSAMDFANTDPTVRRLLIEIGGKREEWAKLDGRWNKATD